MFVYCVYSREIVASSNIVFSLFPSNDADLLLVSVLGHAWCHQCPIMIIQLFDHFHLQPQWREMFESPSSVELPHPPDSPFPKDSDQKVDGDNGHIRQIRHGGK